MSYAVRNETSESYSAKFKAYVPSTNTQAPNLQGVSAKLQ